MNEGERRGAHGQGQCGREPADRRAAAASSRSRRSMPSGRASRSTDFRARCRIRDHRLRRAARRASGGAQGSEGGLAEAIAQPTRCWRQANRRMRCRSFARSSAKTPHNAGRLWRHGALAYRDGRSGSGRGGAERRAGRDRHARPNSRPRMRSWPLARQAENAGPVSELRPKVEADPDDHQARSIWRWRCMPRGRSRRRWITCWSCSAGTASGTRARRKTQLFTIFDALKPNDPVAAQRDAGN